MPTTAPPRSKSKLTTIVAAVLATAAIASAFNPSNPDDDDDDRRAFSVVIESTRPRIIISKATRGDFQVGHDYPYTARASQEENGTTFKDEGTYNPKQPGSITFTAEIFKRTGVRDTITCKFFRPGSKEPILPPKQATTSGIHGTPATVRCTLTNSD